MGDKAGVTALIASVATLKLVSRPLPNHDTLDKSNDKSDTSARAIDKRMPLALSTHSATRDALRGTRVHASGFTVVGAQGIGIKLTNLNRKP